MTELQKFLKTLRIVHEENLRDMAQNLGVSASFLSAVEHGKKAVPPKLEDLIVEKYNLKENRQYTFKKLCGASRKTIIIKTKTERSRKILAFIAKEIDSLDPNQIAAIEKILKKEYNKKENKNV